MGRGIDGVVSHKIIFEMFNKINAGSDNLIELIHDLYSAYLIKTYQKLSKNVHDQIKTHILFCPFDLVLG